MDEMDELAKTLTELATALRRLALDVGLFTVRVSSLESDVRVVRIPRHLVRLERLDPSNN
jgi:hypothetical protein